MLFYLLLFAFAFINLCRIRMLYAQPRARTRRAPDSRGLTGPEGKGF
jgi:hypothetical protein